MGANVCALIDSELSASSLSAESKTLSSKLSFTIEEKQPSVLRPVLSDIRLVSVAGKTHFNRSYAATCIETWRRIHGVRALTLVSDGLREADVERASGLGFEVWEQEEPSVADVLKTRPGLMVMRKSLPTWRHLIDTIVRCTDHEFALLIDTDVFVTTDVAFSAEGLDFIYNCDDIPGFRGSWYLPFFETMVPAINPGFLVLRPSAVDLDELESLVQEYFLRAKNYWWTRQSALAVVVARSLRRGLFDGRDVRVFSGNRKRSPAEIKQNKWKLLGDSRAVVDPKWARECLEGAAVLHLAGRGKDWLWLAADLAGNEGSTRMLKACEAPPATIVERALIASRMFAVQAGRRRRVPKPQPQFLRTRGLLRF